jgi:NADH-quinone oxidoreductase subunit L
LYQAVILTPLHHLGIFLQQIIEKSGIDAFVNNVGTSIHWLSAGVRLLQSGIVGSYIFVMVLGIILLLSIGFLSTIL